MKPSETEAIVLLIFFLFSQCLAAPNSYEHRDITVDRNFGCSWQGGTSSAVTCMCREGSEEMYITENSIASYETSTIEINGCPKVRFGPKAVAEMRNLRNIHLKNIPSLTFEESSLLWYGYTASNQYEERYDLTIPSLKITVENCTVNQISAHTFEGRINTILFDGTTIENMDSFAFTSLRQTENLIIRRTDLKNIKNQPFRKFSTENLELDGTKTDLISSRFLSNLTVYNKFTINNCTFGTVRPGGFLVQGPRKFEVTNTKINQLDGEAFKVTTRGDVLFKNNVFGTIDDGAFRAIELNKEQVISARITFDSNVFTELTRDSLGTNQAFQAKFSNLNINESCDCKSIDRKIKDTQFYADIKCLYQGEFVTVKDFKSNMCSLILSYSTTIVVVGVVLTLCVIIGTVLVVYYRKVHLSQKYGNKKNAKTGNISMIVPDGRTYRETELHVIVERADLLTTDL